MAVFQSENLIAYGFLVLHITRVVQDADSYMDAIKAQLVFFSMACVLASSIKKVQRTRLDATDGVDSSVDSHD